MTEKFYPVNKRQYELFKKECQKWQKFFGLLDWKIEFVFEPTDCLADIHWNTEGKNATVRLSTKWNLPPVDNGIRQTAFHEICEVLLAPLSDFGYLGANRHPVNTEVHSIIRRLENTVFK